MRIQLLGTGAADGIPAFYGTDRISTHARKHGGKDVRGRSTALIDGVLKIDMPPETLSQLHRFGLDPREWTGLVFTHSHEDHFSPGELQYAMFPFTEMDHLGYTVYGNEVIVSAIKARYPEWPMDVRTIRKNRPFKHAKYEITPIHATHKDDEECHNLIISDGDKKFFYATDTGVYSEETFEAVANTMCDALVIECTEGVHKTSYVGHLDVEQCIGMVTRLRESGAVRPNAPVVTTHHAASGGLTHEELEVILAPYAMVPGYDGMTIEI